ncbi:hypothetical protein JRO89_XS03G0008300 [Xanthoceras sorbifolium]|uniref:mRNA guanylyltransferase n=1 Tax=Xanthoceras sorbifolium TaxID=99658 RepID=A0ABQ8I8K3_9ROSI|nr:hypothetical protein JRO89_XS03G0008300 [Xanthoceras sorbifolium]
MDLNASPLPEEDEEIFGGHVEEEYAAQERVESGAEISRREREERRRRLKRDRPDERPVHASQPHVHDQYQNKSSRFYDKNKLPPGWLDCPEFGQDISCIIPSKVPLGEFFNDCIPPGKRYSFKQVIHRQRVLGRKLGLVIDLTNTSRYYQTTDLKKEGIKHVKIQCKGRDAVPDNVSVNNFIYEVTQFLSRQKHPKKYILVHCTHGHNRTGYMIVHYLMRSISMSVTQAIKIFADARPPGIYKPEYIDALYAFYHERKPATVTCPPIPEWKRSSELDLNGEAVPDDDDDGVSVAPLQESHDVHAVMTNDDVLGDEIPHDQLQAFRHFCYQMLKQNVGGLGEKTHHFTLLDGEMIIDKLPDSQKQERRYLIYDMIAINQVSIIERPFYERWKMLEKEIIEPRNYERHNIYQSRNPYYRYDLEPFRVRRKDFWLLSTINKLLSEFIPRLSHDADGLIFQGWDDPYVPRTHEGLLKWKYASMNSVDFLFEGGADDRQLVFLFERGKKKLMEGNSVVFKGLITWKRVKDLSETSEKELSVLGFLEVVSHCGRHTVLFLVSAAFRLSTSTFPWQDGSDPTSYFGKIIECAWDAEERVWICMRIRTDKTTPNDFNTYKKVMRSIRDNITEDVLLNEINEIVRLPMYADRIRNDSKTNSARRR